MDEMMRIHVMIDGKRYPLKPILREKEQLYRDAAKKINDMLNDYRKQGEKVSPRPTKEDLLAMVAFQIALENTSMKDQNDTVPYTRKLEELTQEIEAYISSRKE